MCGFRDGSSPESRQGSSTVSFKSFDCLERNSEVTFVWTKASSITCSRWLEPGSPGWIPTTGSPSAQLNAWRFVSDSWRRDFYRTIGFSFRSGRSTVAGIVPSVAQAIWDCLVGEYMPVPKEEDWRAIAAEFLERWNFPNCLGSIDGKHVVIQAPPCSGSQFYNYKGTYSVVLLAVVDAIYCFRVVDVGAYGKGSDGGTLRDSAFGQALQDGTLEIPRPASLPGAEDVFPTSSSATRPSL
ncbi:uncharacterized protein LOC120032665 [Salvelinus namaycush]|uniref:Uncharacterized protein LOC120032665 n=1 Tax=Salvelinus namaycush TaxID=8040 RepID=A0A8U0Q2F8_SALNM|nr:uncharacterized protein LOC120032665 [Salvelinus namaycush]